MGGRSAEAQFGFVVKAAEEKARKARQEADRLACEAWNLRLEKLGGPVRPSPTLGEAINAGYLVIEVKCTACRTFDTVPLVKIARPPDTPLWQLEAKLICSACRLQTPYPRRGKIVALLQQMRPIGGSWYSAEQRERR